MSFESFKLARDMKDEADELSAAGKKKGLAGAVGGIGGALLLPLLLNPVTLAGAAVAAGVGSIAGNVVGRNLLAPKATKVLSGEDAKFYYDMWRVFTMPFTPVGGSRGTNTNIFR